MIEIILGMVMMMAAVGYLWYSRQLSILNKQVEANHANG